MKTFKCNFGKGIACEVTVSDTPPEKGKSHIRNVTWSKPPRRSMFRLYINWMNSVNEQLANEWNVSIMHVFQLAPNKLETWSYAPGLKPTIVQ